MSEKRYEVLYQSDAPLSQLQKRLSTLCHGAWEVRRVGLTMFKRGSRQYRLFFEQESDIKALLR